MAILNLVVTEIVEGSQQTLSALDALNLVRDNPTRYRLSPPFNAGLHTSDALLKGFQDATGNPSATFTDLLLYLEGPEGPAGTGEPGADGADGLDGADGDDGWSPVFAAASDGTRRVLQVVDWSGGAGVKPATGLYVGAAGLVASIASGVDVRGPAGADGDGTGDMVKATYDTDDDGKVNSAEVADAAPWAGITDKPAAFTPTAHTHDFDDLDAGAVATDAEVRSATAGKLLEASKIESASALVTLTDGANIAVDWDSFINAQVTLGGNRTLDNPTNEQVGTSRLIVVKQDGTGSRTLSYGAEYLFPGGTAPTLSTAANSIDVLQVFCLSATQFLVTSAADFS